MFHALQIMSLALMASSPMPPVPVETAPVVEQGQAGRAGFQVVVDPATGRIVDNPQPFQLDRPSDDVDRRRRSSWDLETFFLAGGGRGVFLDGWADHSLTVHVGPDGEMRFGCSQGDAHEEASAAQVGDGREAAR